MCPAISLAGYATAALLSLPLCLGLASLRLIPGGAGSLIYLLQLLCLFAGLSFVVVAGGKRTYPRQKERPGEREEGECPQCSVCARPLPSFFNESRNKLESPCGEMVLAKFQSTNQSVKGYDMLNQLCATVHPTPQHTSLSSDRSFFCCSTRT